MSTSVEARGSMLRRISEKVDAGSSLASRTAASWPGEFSLLKMSVQAVKSQLI